MEDHAEQKDSRPTDEGDRLIDRKDEWESLVRRLKAAQGDRQGITLSADEVDVLLLALVASAKALITHTLQNLRRAGFPS